MLTTVGILLGIIVILLGVLLAVSPGKAKPFLDEKGRALSGSISEKIHVNINGVQQGMFIIGKMSVIQYFYSSMAALLCLNTS
jgi:hypothetical protein